MSRIIATAAIRGAYKCMDRAETMLSETVNRHGRDKGIEFPGTAYALPVILTLTGKRVEKLASWRRSSGRRAAGCP
jgi:acetyl-CoA synthase